MAEQPRHFEGGVNGKAQNSKIWHGHMSFNFEWVRISAKSGLWSQSHCIELHNLRTAGDSIKSAWRAHMNRMYRRPMCDGRVDCIDSSSNPQEQARSACESQITSGSEDNAGPSPSLSCWSAVLLQPLED